MSTSRDCSGGPIRLGTSRIAQVIERHDTDHYVFIVDEALVEFEKRASSCLMNEGADAPAGRMFELLRKDPCFQKLVAYPRKIGSGARAKLTAYMNNRVFIPRILLQRWR